MTTRRTVLKLLVLSFAAALFAAFVLGSGRAAQPAFASASGPVPAVTGAPGETNCANCHTPNGGVGTFTITAPATYTPGATYQITVRHQTSDSTRRRWGFQMTSLAGTSPAGTLSSLNASTQTLTGFQNRTYIEHTLAGSFGLQAGGAQWTVGWTAPATNVGTVTLYAAGNQANNDGTAEGDQIYSASVAIPAATPQATPRPAAVDFDGDRKTDVAIWRGNAAAEWWFQRSTDAVVAAFQFGAGSDRQTPADFTGDGKTDIAFFRPSTGDWFVLRSEDFSFYSFPFGGAGDVPVTGDYDADGKADPAVFRPSTGTWFINRSTAGVLITAFGSSTDFPIAGDFDGDGKTDVGIFRAADGSWWYNRSSNGVTVAFVFGTPTDKPVPADFTGDGKTDAAFFRPSTGEWFILRSEDGSFFSFPFGASGDVPAAGDYDGDGKTDAAVFRPATANWFVNRSTAGVLITAFGASGDVPVTAAYIP